MTGANERPVLALTGGDPNGIGPEICLKAIGSPLVQSACRPLLIGDPSIFEYYRKLYRLPISLSTHTDGLLPPEDETVPVITVRVGRAFNPSPGRLSTRAGLIAGRSVETAVGLCGPGPGSRRAGRPSAGFVDAIVTAPLSKSSLNRAGFRFPGQTEMVARFSRSGPPLMMLMNGDFRVALVTAHIPLRRVSSSMSIAKVSETVDLLKSSLQADFRIRHPSIAVLALNPHAGEGGTLGSEENAFITPAIRQLRKRGISVSGPFPADGFFANHSEAAYDGIVAMYHDQGLIPLKMKGFSSGVNFTAGLSVIRTSPGHGTAYDIAGRGVADPSSMIEAVLAAVRIYLNRKLPPHRGKKQ